jgi:hypothetical protein
VTAPGVRPNQAEKKVRNLDPTTEGGHGPFRGLDAPFALRPPYRFSNGEVNRAGW